MSCVGQCGKAAGNCLEALTLYLDKIEMEYGRHCVRTAKAENRLTFGDIIAIKYSRLRNVITERKEPHSCTIDGNIDSH